MKTWPIKLFSSFLALLLAVSLQAETLPASVSTSTAAALPMCVIPLLAYAKPHELDNGRPPLVARAYELAQQLAHKLGKEYDPTPASNQAQFWTANRKELRFLRFFQENYSDILREFDQGTEVLGDTELSALGEEARGQSLVRAGSQRAALKMELANLLFTKNDSIVIEIKPGPSSDREQATYAAGQILKAYENLAQTQGWKVEVLEESLESAVGLGSDAIRPIKSAKLLISGKTAFRYLQFESGTHRLLVSAEKSPWPNSIRGTGNRGKKYKYFVDVRAYAEAAQGQKRFALSDVSLSFYKSSGAGGQHRNKTESAVRAIHNPTGVVATNATERKQEQNKQKALEELEKRVNAHYAAEAAELNEIARQTITKDPSRDDRYTRTYDFNKSWTQSSAWMQGDLLGPMQDRESSILVEIIDRRLSHTDDN